MLIKSILKDMRHHHTYRIQDNRIAVLKYILIQAKDYSLNQNNSNTPFKGLTRHLEKDIAVVENELDVVEHNHNTICDVFNNIDADKYPYSKIAWERNRNKPWPRLMRNFNPIVDVVYTWGINSIRNEVLIKDQMMVKSGGFIANQINKISAAEVVAYCADIEIQNRF
tara:strand:- start:362 stop:865 length:504 start_codon:yes stop_codon:yes gene_type:complete